MKMLIFHLISSSVFPSTPYMVVKVWCEESKMHPYQFWYTSRVLKVENAEISAVNSPESPLRKWKCPIFTWYPLLFSPQLHTWSYKFGARKMRCIPTNFSRDLEFWRSKKREFQPKIHQNHPLRKWKFPILTWYPLLFYRQCLTWSYKFGARKMRCIPTNFSRDLEFWRSKKREFQPKIHQNHPLRKWKCPILTWYPLLFSRQCLTWSYKFGARKIRCIPTNFSWYLEFWKAKMRKFQMKIHQN